LATRRRALAVGLNNYPSAPLTACVSDANAIATLLSKHEDGGPNFHCVVSTGTASALTKPLLMEQLDELFAPEADVVLFYFSGHGSFDESGGYLVTEDEEYVTMNDVVQLAHKSEVKQIFVVLDCCYSGAVGNIPSADITGERKRIVQLREGISILTASHASQSSVEVDGKSIFTSYLCDGLEGEASDVLGHVTVASLYAYVDQLSGVWQQRPLFKAHLTHLVELRKTKPHVDLPILRLLPTYFPGPRDEFKLDPSFEPTMKPKNKENEKIFGHLQAYRSARLVEPIGEEHMYYAAKRSKSCRLTAHGRFIRSLAADGYI